MLPSGPSGGTPAESEGTREDKPISNKNKSNLLAIVPLVIVGVAREARRRCCGGTAEEADVLSARLEAPAVIASRSWRSVEERRRLSSNGSACGGRDEAVSFGMTNPTGTKPPPLFTRNGGAGTPYAPAETGAIYGKTRMGEAAGTLSH